MIKKIQKLLRQRESIRLEFKEASGGVPKSLYETVCAFLNREGGDILLGVSDDGKIRGLDAGSAGRMAVEIAAALQNETKMAPPFLVFPQVIEIKGKTLLFLQVPVSSRVHRVNGIVYDRSAEGDFKVTDPAHIAALANGKASYYSESRIFPGVKINDLDKTTILTARSIIRAQMPDHPWLALNDVDLFRKSGLFHSDPAGGRSGFTLAAVLLFGKEETIQSVLPQYKHDLLVRRSDTERYDDRLDVRVNLIESYRLMMGFMDKHLPDPFYMERDQRISLREKIFREVVVNFLVHREYTSGVPGRCVVYKDRVEFTNPCIPHHKGLMTLKNMVPRQKNPLISKFFIQLGWVEEIGSGFVTVNKYIGRYAVGGRAEFYEDDIFKTIVYFSKAQSEQVAGQVGEQVDEQVGEQVARIKAFCREPRTKKEILAHIGLAQAYLNYRRHIRPLIGQGLLRMTMPDKPNSRLQKYVAV